MFRVKTRRNVKRVASPVAPLPTPVTEPSSLDISGSSISSQPSVVASVIAPVVAPIVAPVVAPAPQNDVMAIVGNAFAAVTPANLMSRLSNFFEAESAAVSVTKPWLRLERGLRLQKLRTYAENYPGLSNEEKENLNKMLVKANDAKLLNTKQQIVYEGGKIMNIRGLKVNPSANGPSFKIEVHRQTKKKGNE